MKSRSACAALSVALLVGFAAFSQQAPNAIDEKILAKAKSIHERAITLDSHVDIPDPSRRIYDPGDKSPAKCSLPNMEKGGLKGVFVAVFVGQNSQLNDQTYKAAYDSAIAKFSAVHRVAEEMYPDRCAIAYTPADAERIAKTGKRVLIIGIENGFVVGTDLSLIKKYYDLGARYITLSHSGNNQICDSSSGQKPLHNGLSNFGVQVVAEMNRLGIMVDVSHISEKSFFDVIKTSKTPIIASHSGCSALCPNSRNLTDEQLKALSKNGGVIQVVVLGDYLKPDSPERRPAIAELNAEFGLKNVYRGRRPNLPPDQEEKFAKRMKEIDQKYPPATVKDFADHIDHAVKVAGIEHVGIGTDFDGGGGIPGFNDHSECLNVTVELVRRGYSEKDIDRIWGGNLLRVWREVAKAAAKTK